jgi:hypothetical protein
MGIFLVLLQADLPYFPQTTSALLKVWQVHKTNCSPWSHVCTALHQFCYD